MAEVVSEGVGADCGHASAILEPERHRTFEALYGPLLRSACLRSGCNDPFETFYGFVCGLHVFTAVLERHPEYAAFLVQSWRDGLGTGSLEQYREIAESLVRDFPVER